MGRGQFGYKAIVFCSQPQGLIPYRPPLLIDGQGRGLGVRPPEMPEATARPAGGGVLAHLSKETVAQLRCM